MLSPYNAERPRENKKKSTTIWKPYYIDTENVEIKKERTLAAQFQNICKIFDTESKGANEKLADFPKRHNLGVIFVTQPKHRSRVVKKKDLKNFSMQAIMNECRDVSALLKSSRNPNGTDSRMKSCAHKVTRRKRYARRGKSATRRASAGRAATRAAEIPRMRDRSARAGSCPPQLNIEGVNCC